jgi:hypothetical protein
MTLNSPDATPKYKVLVSPGDADGNPDERLRVGDDGLRFCLEQEYGIKGITVASLISEAKNTGEASLTLG